jgi:hypothetical protein
LNIDEEFNGTPKELNKGKRVKYNISSCQFFGPMFFVSANMEPLPYNITVSSSAASLKYSPARDTQIDWGWNITYSDGIYSSPYGPQGIGSAIHRTTNPGSTIELNWVGTAVYLYGNATRVSYQITVDSVDIGDVGGQGLLGSKTELQYGEHSAVLTALGGSTVSFWYADVTIGVGYPEYVACTVMSVSSTDLDDQQIFATDQEDSSDYRRFQCTLCLTSK